MFSIFEDKSPEAQKKRARAAYEKIVAMSSDSASARSLRMRMGLLCRAHLDKTFIAGAEQTALHQDLVAIAVAHGKEPPRPPTASMFQVVGTSKDEKMYVYVPPEYADEAFALGRRYQKMEINAEQAISGMQQLANQMCMYELRLEEPFQVLRFLREEIAGENANQEATDVGVENAQPPSEPPTAGV